MPSEAILVAEDNAVERERLAVALRQQGYTVLTAADGAEAARKLLDPAVVPSNLLMKRTITDDQL
jgi:CheY-like chemotaxis protein